MELLRRLAKQCNGLNFEGGAVTANDTALQQHKKEMEQLEKDGYIKLEVLIADFNKNPDFWYKGIFTEKGLEKIKEFK